MKNLLCVFLAFIFVQCTFQSCPRKKNEKKHLFGPVPSKLLPYSGKKRDLNSYTSYSLDDNNSNNSEYFQTQFPFNKAGSFQSKFPFNHLRDHPFPPYDRSSFFGKRHYGWGNEYMDRDVCRSQGIAVREFVPNTVLDELEEKYLETKCKFLSTFSVYPPNIASQIPRYTDEGEGEEAEKLLTYDIVAIGTGPGILSALKTLSNLDSNILLLEPGLYPPQKAVSLYYRPTLLQSEYSIRAPASAPKCDTNKTVYIANVIGDVTTIDDNAWDIGPKSFYKKWGEISDQWTWDEVSKYFKRLMDSNHHGGEEEKGPDQDEITRRRTVSKYNETSEFQSKERSRLKTTEVSENADGRLTICTSIVETTVTREVRTAFMEIGICDETIRIASDAEDRREGWSIIPVIQDEQNGVIYAQKMFQSIQGKNNVDLSVNTEIVDIVFSSEGKACGVRIRTPNGGGKITTIKIREELILSTDVITSVGILMKSGVGRRETLKKLGIPVKVEAPYMGKNLTFSPLYIGSIFKFPAGELVQDHESDFAALEYLYGQTKMAPGVSLNFFKAFLKIDSDEVNVQVNLYAFSKAMCKRLHHFLSGFFHFDKQALKYVTDLLVDHDLLFAVPQVLDTYSKGRVSIREHGGKFVPDIDTGLYENERDLDVMMQAVEQIERVAQTKIIRERKGELVQVPISKCEPSDKRCLIRYLSVPNLLATGGLIMGKHCHNSVVDENLIIHNTRNVRVMNSGVIPCGLPADSSACVSMIGLKGSDLVSQKYKQL